jgi:baculoviral IAP repeat-containing protein 6 (apollon)
MSMSESKNNIVEELNKWIRKRDDSLSALTYIKNEENKLTFKYKDTVFHVSYPNDYPNNRFALFCIEYTDTSLNWLGYVNIYCCTKKPKKLYSVLKKIGNEFIKHHNATVPDYTEVDGTDLYHEESIINSFDIEIGKLRNKLYKNIKNCSSAFTLDKTDTKAPQLFKGSDPGSIILNEFISLSKKYKNNDKVTLNTVNDNIYHWKLKLKDFTSKAITSSLESLNEYYGYDYIEIDVYFHHKYYPSYPPVLKYVRPRLNKCLMHRLSNLKMIQTDYWIPSRGMEFVVSKLKSILNEHADINISSKLNDIEKYNMGAYMNLENHLMKLAAYCDNVEEFSPLDKTKYDKVYNKEDVHKTMKKRGGKYWSQGTGYGTTGSHNWDINKYVQLEKEKELQVKTLLEKIVVSIQDSSDLLSVYKTIDGSYLISYLKSILGGASFLEMGNHTDLYQVIFTILQNLITEDSIFLFAGKDDGKGIIDILGDLSKKADNMQKLMKDKESEHNVGDIDVSAMVKYIYEMAKASFDVFNVSGSKTSTKKIDDDDENSEQKEYITKMDNYKYSNCNIQASQYYFTGLSGSITKKVMKRIASEYTSLMDSLPIHFNASILFRSDTDNLRVCRALITGPDDTPYDSGMFIFDFLLPTNYPAGPPQVKIRNNGNQRFNPNLYNCGKVCLSLLGTWPTSNPSENWNSKTSTLYQVLNSIQSLILIGEPYYNEPGWERLRGTPKGVAAVKAYNNNIRLYTMRHTMSDLMENPSSYGGFEDAIKTHFKLKKDYILKVCGKWVDESPSAMKALYNTEYDRLKKNLKSL